MVTSKGFFGFVLTIFLLDQVSKLIILASLHLLPLNIIPQLLSISYTTNTGIAFGFFQGSNMVFLIFSLSVAGFLAWYWKKLKSNLEIIAAALILGATLGNVTDRIFRGHVVDFISVSGFSTFNIADSALTIGASLILASFLYEHIRKLPT